MTGLYQPAADARTAASLLLLRDGEQGLEVLMMRRAERDGDLRSGAAVFPGGALDPRDRLAHRCCLGPEDAEVSQRLGLQEGGLDYLVASVRETFEEVGLLLVDGAFGLQQVQRWRERLQAGTGAMADLCDELGLKLDLRGLVYFSHWLTPPGLPKRFDTRFFAVLAPLGQVAVPDLDEALELMWLTPLAALDPERGLKILPVTRRTLQELGRSTSAAEALASARSRSAIGLTMPRVARSSRGPRILLPDDWAYAEVARLDFEGRHDASCELLPGHAVRLSPRLWRVTAPNAGAMTGPGTNSYLVGSGGLWTAIDPGPVGDEHLQALLAALQQAGGRLERILVTHTHKDHSPGAAALAQATGAPVWGRVAEHADWQDTCFAPAYQPVHGERINAGPDCSLRVIHTPGHASNHLCYLLEQERTLLTGDHVMQGSTVVINPPDGDMAAYLQSLNALLEIDLEWLAPGHGFLVAEPHGAIRRLIAHRQQREAKVLAALIKMGPATADALLADVYHDVPLAKHPVALRSLTAHLLKLCAEGKAIEARGRYSAGT